MQHCCNFCTNKLSRSFAGASFNEGNLTNSRFLDILKRDELRRLSLRMLGTPAIGCTFVNAVCGGWDKELRFVSEGGWAESVLFGRDTVLVVALLPTPVLLADDSFPFG